MGVMCDKDHVSVHPLPKSLSERLWDPRSHESYIVSCCYLICLKKELSSVNESACQGKKEADIKKNEFFYFQIPKGLSAIGILTEILQMWRAPVIGGRQTEKYRCISNL